MKLPVDRIVFWEPSVSPHKAPLFAEIKNLLPAVEMIHMAQTTVTSERLAMGWAAPEPNGYIEYVSPAEDICIQVASASPDKSFHVFSGIRHVPCIVTGLAAVLRSGARFALMTEPRVNEGFNGILRYIQSWITEGELRRKSTCVLAIGRNGPPWFLSVGYASHKVFPFAYFIDQSPTVERHATGPKTKLKIGFLGRLVRAKGIFTLLSAFARFSQEDATLELAGPIGDEATAILEAVDLCAATVSMHGPMPMTEVSGFLSKLDILILPSITKDDGWGVVVTEALMQGVAVVATNCVGASVVLDDPRLGMSIEPNEPKVMLEAIRSLAQPHCLSTSARKWRSEWAEAHLSAKAGARYFCAVLDHKLNQADSPMPFYEQ